MDTFEIPLGLSEVKIEKVEITQKGDFIITVRSLVEETTCHKCGQTVTKFHGHDKAITLRHLSILGKETSIRIIPKRYQCFSCDSHPTTTQTLSWYNNLSFASFFVKFYPFMRAKAPCKSTPRISGLFG